MMEKQQIVFVERVPWAGGAEKVVYHLTHGLDKERFEPHVVCLFNQPNTPAIFSPEIKVYFIEPFTVVPSIQQETSTGWRRRYLKWEGKLRHSLGIQPLRAVPPDFDDAGISILLQSLGYWQPYVSGLRQILKNFHSNALLVPIMEEASVLVWLSQLFDRRPYVVSLHSVESYNMPLIYPDPRKLAVEDWMLANACKSAETVIVPSHGCRTDLIQRYDIQPDQVKVLPNPVDLDLMLAKREAPAPQLSSMARTKFVYIGRLAEDKNPALLVEAAFLLKQTYDNFVVYFAGKGPLLDNLQALVAAKGLTGHIVFLGELENPYPLMAQARALIVTSHVESFSLVLVEAMYCGAVAISVGCAFGPREVLENGRFGLLSSQDDAVSLAESMRRVACDDDLYHQLKKRGFDRAQEYGIRRVIPAWEEMFASSSLKDYKK